MQDFSHDDVLEGHICIFHENSTGMQIKLKMMKIRLLKMRKIVTGMQIKLNMTDTHTTERTTNCGLLLWYCC